MASAKKICLIGRFAVGKTSLVKRFVKNEFGERYKTTVGVSISTKSIGIDENELPLVVWDISGFEQDGHYQNYLRGAHGLIWVVDGTEPESFNILDLIFDSMPEIKSIPSVCLINKVDLKDDWLVTDEMLEKLKSFNYSVLNCSAKTGENVEKGFVDLARQLI